MPPCTWPDCPRQVVVSVAYVQHLASRRPVTWWPYCQHHLPAVTTDPEHRAGLLRHAEDMHRPPLLVVIDQTQPA